MENFPELSCRFGKCRVEISFVRFSSDFRESLELFDSRRFSQFESKLIDQIRTLSEMDDFFFLEVFYSVVDRENVVIFVSVSFSEDAFRADLFRTIKTEKIGIDDFLVRITSRKDS